jgi:ornithine cyclodeaminase/alanine dehydrogenase-like protein (mu-crystallin family)
MPGKVRCIGEAEIRRAISMRETVELMGGAFAQISAGTPVVPQRLRIEMPQREGRALVMPAYSSAQGQLGMKLVTLFRNNPEAGLPYIHAIYLLMDGHDGRPLAIMDGEYLTAIRTGAASGLATQLLARPESSTAVIIGAGAQGRFQLEGICAARTLQRAYVCDRNPDRAERFAREMASRVECEIVPAADSGVVREADIVCTATTSTEPVFRDADIRPGTHINAVGAYRVEMREIPPETIHRARIVVDSRASCLLEAGDLIAALSQPGAPEREEIRELGEIVSGGMGGRDSRDQITLFKSVGNAVQDLVTARRILENAERRSLGLDVEL